ncbi:NAD(P)-dependent alcohol dehydrogenase [Streptomyces sp. P9-A2]|uniref:NAD(P)-dependent alcohol dehydrogenase n=1 Tax=Streptomyces sp. P9-A2 TaxID=3072284 RepID=UPI002FCA44B7
MTDTATAREITAAVVRKKGSFESESAVLDAPRDDEVLVRIVATGLCHTDLVVRDQVYPVPLPVVLGHEGAGVVEAVGTTVEKVAPGDHVAISFLPCGRCHPCFDGSPASCANFNAINFAGRRPNGSHALRSAEGDGTLHDRFFGQSSFATYEVTNERNTVKVRAGAPLELLGPLGCGIQTGAGTVLRALKVGAGATFAVMGTGAVGLSTVMAARVAGATTVIAVDVLPSRLELATELGATHVVNGREKDAVDEIRRITGGGVAFALGDSATARRTRGALARAVGGVLAAAVALADPRLIVLGGLWGAEPGIAETIREHFAELPRSVPVAAAQVTEPELAGARARAVEELRTVIITTPRPESSD